MNREDEMKARELRRFERWWKSLDAKVRAELKKETTGDTPTNLALLEQGYIERSEQSPTGFVLTGKGELYLHQLRLKEWMAKRDEEKNPPPSSDLAKKSKPYYGGLPQGKKE